MASLIIDDMEAYSTSELAQNSYVTNDVGTSSQYPPSQNDTYVKATSSNTADDFYPFYATDPTKSLTGNQVPNSWAAAENTVTNQRFHIDLGSAKIVKRIYYENFHNSGVATNRGVQNFTFWGSNTAASFAELTYATDTGWTQITPAQTTFDQHVAENAVDPKYITVTNTTAYRYYAFKFADNYGNTLLLGVRRIELQVLSLQSYSEATIKTQGSYALKGVAAITDSLNKTLTKTFTIANNLVGMGNPKFDIRSNRTGSNVKIGLYAGATMKAEITPNIITADTFQRVNWDLSAISDADKSAIDKIIITIVNADAQNIFYIDGFGFNPFIDIFGIC